MIKIGEIYLGRRDLIKICFRSLFLGMKCAVAFIFLYQVLFALTYRFTPGAVEHLYADSNWRFAKLGDRMLGLMADYPTGLGYKVMEMNFEDPFLALLIYVPYIASFQYLVLGCLAGLLLSVRKCLQKEGHPPEAEE